MMFLKGLAFGFILAATVGPMWVLCFRRRAINVVSGLSILAFAAWQIAVLVR